jgi:ketosteroid isomerase-like protein
VITSAQANDIAELNQLAYRYAAAVDTCDVAAFVDVFHPDAQMRVYRPGEEAPFTVVRGSDELRGVPEAMRQRFTRTAHLMTNHLITVDGDSASGSLLCTARHLHANGAGGVDLVIVIRYVDRYERRQGAWRIADRAIHFLWGETHAALKDEHTW